MHTQRRPSAHIYFTCLNILPFSTLFLKWARKLRHAVMPYKEDVQKGKYLIREGSCNQCGSCCKNLFLSYGKEVIKDREDFEALKSLHPDEYGFFDVLRESEFGLIFKCNNLGDDDLCMDYHARPVFCRSYPNEAGVLMGAKLPADCSFKFTPIKSFDETLTEVH
jgi:hypothetical protein